MFYMGNVTIHEKEVLGLLGERLRGLRLLRNESQEIMGERLGMSRQRYARMESGDPRIPIGSWIAASSLLNRLDDWHLLLQEAEDLFLRAEIERKRKNRKRASKK